MKNSIKTALAIALLVTTWGLAWPIYKNALAFSPPILLAGMRTFLGGLLLTLFLIPTWKKIKLRENWAKYCISAFFNTIIFFGLQTVGLVYMPGGLFSVLVYFQPVLIALFAALWLGEPLTKLKISGLIVGFVGIIIISANGFTGELSSIGIFMALVTAIGWALGTIYVKKVSHKVDYLWMISLQLIIGGTVLTCTGFFIEDFSTIVWNKTYLFALAYGTTLGIPIAFILYFRLINLSDSSKVASFTFLVPVIAVLVGTIFMNEPFTASLFIGLILIVISISFVNYSSKKTDNTMVENVKQIS